MNPGNIAHDDFFKESRFLSVKVEVSLILFLYFRMKINF